VGDIHYESRLFCRKYWTDFIHRAKSLVEAGEDVYFFLMGDYIDGTSTSERAALRSANLHETTTDTLDDTYKGIVKQLTNELKFMKGRVIGAIGGNHYHAFQSGDTRDNMICRELGCSFLGCTSFVNINIQSSKVKSLHTTLDIVANHGQGGGKRVGSTFNTLEDFGAWVPAADIVLMGHDHKRGVVPSMPSIFYNTRGKHVELREHIQYYGRTGSFLRSYVHGERSYNADACRRPVNLGWIEFEIELAHTKTGTGAGTVTKRIRGIA
jgi:hypothetical protein